MLIKSEILYQINQGRIQITPFESDHVGPNSYDVHLAKNLYVAPPHARFDVLKDNRHLFVPIEIPNEGWELLPGHLYIGMTIQAFSTPYHIMMLEGMSSYGRLGLAAHWCAGFGDIGYNGHWVVELVVTHPTRIYYGMPIAQVAFHEPIGEAFASSSYQAVGRYNNAFSPNPMPILSRAHEKPFYRPKID